MSNLDPKTVEGFGDEWTRFDQSTSDDAETERIFEQYFRIFPWSALPADAVGFDLGCGSGRWAKRVAPRVGKLHCIDASGNALAVAEKTLAGLANCQLHCASVDRMPLAEASMDFGYSLGVLHHVPDTPAGIEACVAKLKPGAPLLLYLYYAFDNRSRWFRAIWKASDLARRVISRMPPRGRYAMSQLLAAGVYFPLARSAALLERAGASVEALPLAAYRNLSFYVMRNDALDRFGTRLEQRFSADAIRAMMAEAGLERITIGDALPYWCAVGFKR